MSTGKKIGIIALIVAVLFLVSGMIVAKSMPEIPAELYKLSLTDYEAYMEETTTYIKENTSTLNKVMDIINTILLISGIILAIVSLVMLSKRKEKGKKFAVWAIIVIVISYFVIAFSCIDMGAAFEAGMQYAEEQQ